MASPGTKTLSIPVSELIPRSSSIQRFSSLLGDVDSVSALLSASKTDESAPSHYVIVLAPTNPAMSALTHKPWESTSDYKTLGAKAYAGEQGTQRADENLKQFVERHVVLLKPGKSSWGAEEKAETAAGTEIWYQTGDDGKMLKPVGVKIINELQRGINGEVWEIDGVLT